MITSYGFTDGGHTPDWVLNDFYTRPHLYSSARCLVELLAIELTTNGHRNAGDGRLDVIVNSQVADSFQCHNHRVITYPRQGKSVGRVNPAIIENTQSVDCFCLAYRLASDHGSQQNPSCICYILCPHCQLESRGNGKRH
jgi:hypothetical protein